MNILIAAGGSGGHIFPALSLAGELKKINPDCNIVLIGGNRKLELELFKKSNCNYRLFNLIAPSSKLSFRIFLFLLQFIKSIFWSFKLLQELKPKAVVGFGGYISLPLVLAAKCRNIPVIIHEQNVLIGKANRLLAPLANKIALSFKESAPFIKQKRKIVISGNPVRFNFLNKNKSEAVKYFLLEEGKFTIFVTGGSQGAHFLNQVLLELAAKLNEEEKGKLQFIHLTGADDFSRVEQNYKNYKIKAAVFSFLDKMDLAYLAGDLIISRSGATTVAEICAFGQPSILVPYPFAGGHQKFNALALEGRGAAVVIEQKNLNALILKDTIISLLNDNQRLESISTNSRNLSNLGGAEKLAQEVISLC